MRSILKIYLFDFFRTSRGISPARPEQAGKKEKGFRSTSPQGIFARLLSCEAGLRISARRLRRRAVKSQRRDFPEKRFGFYPRDTAVSF